MTKQLFIGLMAGTSGDGVDAALVDLSNDAINTLATNYIPYPPDLRQAVIALAHTDQVRMNIIGELDTQIGQTFADSVASLLSKAGISADEVVAIGSHGQTIYHAPDGTYPFTMQIGDPNIIAARTNITTIADFRRKDIALGGQGAPLVPAFHQHLFADQNINRLILNIGGISNVTILSKDGGSVIGFDTGPGNALMDCWIAQHQQQSQDNKGAWAASGKIQTALLKRFLADTYFQKVPPKSTGRDYFNLRWIQKHVQHENPVDVQTTLAALTAQTALAPLKHYFDNATSEVLVCGGGAHNDFLMQQLQTIAGSAATIKPTNDVGVDGDYVEAITFAWLAYCTFNRKSSNIPSVTGATREAILGGIFYP